MRVVFLFVCLLAAISTVFGQAPTGPVVEARGVINAFTQTPAPSSVAPGGIIWITGLNLASSDQQAPKAGPLPTKLGDAEVRIDGTAAPLFSVSSGKIVAQVPWDTKPGSARVVVVSPNGNSKVARITVRAFDPSVRTAGDTGFGAAFGKVNGSTLTLSANGLGPTTPPATDGMPGDGTMTAPVRVFVGGMPADATATLATDRVGEFDVAVKIPPTAQPGDLISVFAGALGNQTTFQSLKAPDVQFLALPQGSPEIVALVPADLKGNYLMVNGARDTNGCYPSILFDFANKAASPIGDCLTSANRNAASPIVAAGVNNALAAFVGPPVGELPDGVSSSVEVFNPANAKPLTAQLPAAATTLTSARENFLAVIPGTPPSAQSIDALTAEVNDAGNVTGGAGLAPPPQKVDLGNGLTVILASVRLSATMFALVVGDDADAPKNAKVAIVDDQDNVTGTQDFPSGWLPLVAPKNPAAPPAVGAALARLRVTTVVTAAGLNVLARSAAGPKHAFVAFAQSGPSVIPFPDGWFAAACTTTISLSTLALSNGIVLDGATSEDLTFKNPCPAQGFLIFDPATSAVSAVPLPNQGQINAGVAGDVSDYHYATNFSPRGTPADTLFVLDGATQSAFSLSLPAGIASFAAPGAITEMNSVVALANNRGVGDAGIVVFNLDQGQAAVLPVPDGFQTVTPLGAAGLAGGFLPATRKLVVRGNKAGGAGSQYIVYDLSDLMNGTLFVVPNPNGVAFVGGAPAQQGQPNVTVQRVNARSNTITAVGVGSDRKQLGIIVVRVP